MDWVPDLIGNHPRREENGGDEIEKTVGVEKRGRFEQIETELTLETEIAVEIESQTQSFEIESRETEIDEIQNGKTEIVESESDEKIEIVELEIETES